MSSAEDLKNQIAATGEAIRKLKTEKPPTLKEDLDPLVKSLLALKLSYKELTGEDIDGKPEKPKEKKAEDDGAALRAKKKAERVAQRQEQQQQQTVTTNTEDEFDPLYGDVPLIQSGVMTERIFRRIADLTEERAGEICWIRGRVANTRAVGKGIFLIIRQTLNSVQCILFQGKNVSKSMVKYASGISLESIIDIKAEITRTSSPVQSTTVKSIELNIIEIHVVSRAQELPFLVDDAGRSDADSIANQLPQVNPENCLNFRWIDLRTPANQAIYRIQSGVCDLFREFLKSKDFVEIHSPKLIGGASEGGANVFTLKYFDQPACLAQSPQFYKQIAAACSGFERVFEIGPVFRAENSNTHRHLCEFTGLDFEMAIVEHYYEALMVMGDLFAFIFDGITDRFSHELNLIGQQYPFEPLKFCRPTLRITFQEGITMLREAGFDASYDEDISTPHEKALGKLVKDKYDTDFYIMDKYPLAVRPFYTMPDPENPKLSNSYDLFIRGEEIVSGAQRVHDVNLLIERANAWGVPISSIQAYVDAFKHGALPHAGGGIGLERVVMLYLGLKNIRKTSMFPRDPGRLSP